MSYRLMAEVLARSRAPGPARLVLVALADRMNGAGLCWCSVTDLAERTGFCEWTVRRALKTLEATGELAIEHRLGRTHRYRITLPTSPRPRSTGSPGAKHQGE
jgi:DNA-binding transcriptional regulator PaaX